VKIKILWCGGSHLTFARNSILTHPVLAESVHDFFISAGGPVFKWSRLGGRYEKLSQYRLRGFKDERLSLSDEINFNSYDIVVFIGQYIQPSRIFSDPEFNWRKYLSHNVLVDITLNSLNFAPHPKFKEKALNEPLLLFKQMSKPGSKVILFADPFVHIESSMENNYYYVYQTPLRVKNIYYQTLNKFCNLHEISYLQQDPITYDPSLMATYVNYSVDRMNDWHMNEEFWKLNLDRVLVPKILSS
jgi:hypothetical protein